MSNPYEQFLQAKIGNLPLNRGVSFDEFENARLNGLLKSLQPNPQLMNNMSNVSQKINQQQINKPQPKLNDQRLRNQQLGNFLLAFSDTLRGVNPAQGVLQRQALIDTQQKEADKKRKIDEYKKNNPGMVGMLEALDSGIPYQLLMMQQKEKEDGNKLSFANEDKLRDEHQKLSGTFIDVRDAYGRILSNAEEQTAASDLSLIFNYMKMLDPGSVVREGEFANAQNSAGVPDQIKAKYNGILNGERLAPNTRKDFIETAQDLYETQLASQNYLDNNYRNLATEYDLDPNKVVLDFNSPITEKQFKYNLSIMSDDQLAILDENQFTEEQMEEINKEIDKRLN